ncbi:MAG: hypothetical protein KGJ80_11265 [Chloroflexota bacterium]|nr:hypothetical protein [Chloroflexota bacterium]
MRRHKPTVTPKSTDALNDLLTLDLQTVGYMALLPGKHAVAQDGSAVLCHTEETMRTFALKCAHAADQLTIVPLTFRHLYDHLDANESFLLDPPAYRTFCGIGHALGMPGLDREPRGTKAHEAFVYVRLA